ncbi:MAG: HIRAN domain-containing protein [Clostridiales bacterium]|nr:HIRAN domain-containing protein [Clostridiales bacterium]
MSKVYITLTGTKYRFGTDFLKPGMKVRLVKEPDNEYDAEAIKVMMKGMGQLGYVANSWRTVIGDSCSAGRIYDRIGDTAKAKIVHVLPYGAVLKVSKKSLLGYKREDAEIKPMEENTTYEMDKGDFGTGA